MSIEAVRMISDWFKDPTNGANAMLAGLTLDKPGDARPDPFAVIVDELSDGDVARDGLPSALPSLVVNIDPVRDLDGIVQQVDADGTTQLRFRMPVNNARTELARLEVFYRIRAVKQSFRRFMRQDGTNRQRNGIYLETCQVITTTVENVVREEGNPIVVGYVLPTVVIRELEPYG